jgi:hypothetical protein
MDELEIWNVILASESSGPGGLKVEATIVIKLRMKTS